MDELSGCLTRPILYHASWWGWRRESMRRHVLASLWLVAIFITFAAGAVQAAELIWQVENPFRFFKTTRSFAMHEAAFNAARGAPDGPLPVDIIWRTERKPQRSRLQGRFDARIAAPRPRARAISRAGSAGPRRRSATTATRATAGRAAIRRSASANIPGARPRKTTSCRTPTRCKSRSRPSSSPA